MPDWLEKLAPPHSECAQTILEAFDGLGGSCELYERDKPPEPKNGSYQPSGYACPHGTIYWVLPTDEQIQLWEASR